MICFLDILSNIPFSLSFDTDLFSLISNARCIYKYLCFQNPPTAAEGSLANRITNKRKSIAIPVDHVLRRYVQPADEVSHFYTCRCCSCVPYPNPYLYIFTHISHPFYCKTSFIYHYISSF